MLDLRHNLITGCSLALIKCAGGLYGRILTEVVSTDLTAFGLYTTPQSRFSHTDRLSLNGECCQNLVSDTGLVGTHEDIGPYGLEWRIRISV